MKRENKKQILIGMSGGVDSSVSAALLKKRGYSPIGITFQMLPQDEEKMGTCCNINTITDAKRVCHKLDIPHYTINIRDTFQKNVIQPFIANYLQGLTPNPCVECNRHIKFDELIKVGKELGVDLISTGHYCKRTYSATQDTYFLKKAEDDHKDQTYFLYMLTQEQLRRIRFPLSNLRKPQIRKLAHDFGLINADRPESQEICFVSQRSYKDFIAQESPHLLPAPGPVLDTKGKQLGHHQGIHTVTIGQRKGLGIAAANPLYVLKIDRAKNAVIVGEKDELSSSQLSLKTPTLINPKELILGQTFQIKSRYNMTPFLGKVTAHTPEEITLTLPIQQRFFAPGQSGVLYKKDRVVGGGII